MVKIFMQLCFFLFVGSAFGQDCVPEDNLPADFLGVFPKPFVEEDPDSGIKMEACIGEEYNLTLTVFVPAEYDLGFGFPLTIESITLIEVEGLPEGLEVECNTQDCIYPSEMIDCLVLKGIPTTNNSPGDYDLLIKMTANTNLNPNLPIEFPGILAMGKYTIKLNPAGSGACDPSSIKPEISSHQISIYPNPANNLLTIQSLNNIEINNSKNGLIKIYSLTGAEKLIATFINFSDLNKEIDISALSPGMHYMNIFDDSGKIIASSKFIKL